jgi:hypothetical protein
LTLLLILTKPLIIPIPNLNKSSRGFIYLVIEHFVNFVDFTLKISENLGKSKLKFLKVI